MIRFGGGDNGLPPRCVPYAHPLTFSLTRPFHQLSIRQLVATPCLASEAPTARFQQRCGTSMCYVAHPRASAHPSFLCSHPFPRSQHQRGSRATSFSLVRSARAHPRIPLPHRLASSPQQPATWLAACPAIVLPSPAAFILPCCCHPVLHSPGLLL